MEECLRGHTAGKNSNMDNKRTWCPGTVVIKECLSFRGEVLTLGDKVSVSFILS